MKTLLAACAVLAASATPALAGPAKAGAAGFAYTAAQEEVLEKIAQADAFHQACAAMVIDPVTLDAQLRPVGLAWAPYDLTAADAALQAHVFDLAAAMLDAQGLFDDPGACKRAYAAFGPAGSVMAEVLWLPQERPALLWVPCGTPT